MPLVSQSADQGQTKERAGAIRRANGRSQLTELISKKPSETNNKSKKRSFFLSSSFSFFAFRNLDSFELISVKLLLWGDRHSLDMCWFQSKVPTWNGPLASSRTLRSCNSFFFLISACRLYWPHSNSAKANAILFFIKNPITNLFHRTPKTVLSIEVQMSRLSWVL